jgi:hypothetical protein
METTLHLSGHAWEALSKRLKWLRPQILENYSIFPPDISSIANFFHAQRAHELVLFSEKLFGMRITMTGGTWPRYALQKRSALPSIHPAETAVEHNSGANTAIPLPLSLLQDTLPAFMHLYNLITPM